MTNTQLARAFLTDVAEGRIDQAYDRYVDMAGVHHNIYFAAGFEALKNAMIEGQEQFPNKKFEIQHMASTEDIVMVHSKLILNPDLPGMGTLHVLKFKAGKIVEMWDLGNQEPKDMPNTDGMF